MKVLLGLIVLVLSVISASGFNPMDHIQTAPNLDRYDFTGDLVLHGVPIKRSCIARGGSCDHRAGDCCESLSCRCNLWGANCRCQRRGIF